MVDEIKNLTLTEKNYAFEQEEFPKLRKPKESTLQRIRTNQKNNDNSKIKMVTKNLQATRAANVSLRQEFLSKKVEIQKAASNLLKKYERHTIHRNIFDDTSSESSDEAKPLTLSKKFKLQHVKDLEDLKAKCEAANPVLKIEPQSSSLKTQTSKTSSKNLYDILTFLEHHLFKIIHTKVSAHPNGFFAENIPVWYKKTFDKEIDPNWLDILKKSQQFYIENIQNKIVLYTKSDEDEAVSDIDINASGDIGKNGKINQVVNNKNLGNETPGGFVRYKHLQKSLQEYANFPNRKSTNKSVDKNIAIKPINKLNALKKNQLINST